MNDRLPPKPEFLVGALHDPIHPNSGRLIDSKRINDWWMKLSRNGKLLASQWNKPCCAMFDEFAIHLPNDLFLLVSEKRLSSGELTFAAEILGRTQKSVEVQKILTELVFEHPSPLVREGALYGLESQDVDLRPTLLLLLEKEKSPAMISIATELLEEYK